MSRDNSTADQRCHTEYNVRVRTGKIDSERKRPEAEDMLGHLKLIWDNTDDLDIHILPPQGSEIYYVNPLGTGHFLLLDENASSPYKNKPVEDHFWINKAPSGKYQVNIANYSGRNSAFTSFAVHFTPYKDGRPLETITYDSTDDKGLGNKERVSVGYINVEHNSATFIVEPPKFTDKSRLVQNILFQRMASQPEGFPVAIRVNREAEPVTEVDNGTILNIIEDIDDTWYAISFRFQGVPHKGYVKKRNTKEVTTETYPSSDAITSREDMVRFTNRSTGR